ICCFSALPFAQVSLPQEVAVMYTRGVGAFIAADVFEYPDCPSGITTHDFDGRLNQRNEYLINYPVFRILSDPLVNQGLGPLDFPAQGKGDRGLRRLTTIVALSDTLKVILTELALKHPRQSPIHIR